MANFRVFYPIHYVALGRYCTASGTAVHGVQSVNLTTSFNLERVFELGQLDIYENIENLPSIEMTLEKVLDGYPLIYHLATRGSTSATLLNRSNQRADVIFNIFSDAQDNSSGTPLTQAYCSGMYVNSLNYRLPVQGNLTESVTLVGNDKLWKTSNFLFAGPYFVGTDSPASGTQRRQNVKMGNAAANGSVWPSIIPGVTVSNGSGYNVETAGQFGAHIQDVSISVNLGREDLFELGRRKPYYRYANFPTAVDCVINITAGGTNPGDTINALSDVTANLSNEPIVIKIEDGTIFNLGIKNKLQSVNYSGGDTGGGVVTISYSFQNYNRLDVTSPTDPDGLTA
jgi:hypothetical protein